MQQTKGDEKFTILTGGLHLLTDELEKWGVEEGHTTHRMVAKARRELVGKLHDEGLTQRQIAALTGSSVATVNRDINGQDSVSNETNETENETEPEPFIPPTEIEQWQASLLNMAEESITLTGYWDDKFDGWEQFEATPHMITQARRAAAAWSEIAAQLEGKNK